MLNKVVLHFVGGEIRKGTTEDFAPNKETFHLKDAEGGNVSLIDYKKLKAVFFVKSFEGNPHYQERTGAERTGFGRKVRVDYYDGESQIGYTQGFAPNRPGFFIFPADANSNNDRIFVITKATSEVVFL